MRSNLKTDIVLLCGGKGTRFRDVTRDALPKSLYAVDDKELLSYTTDSLDFTMIGTMVFAVGHQDDKLIAWVQSQEFPCRVAISYQKNPGIVGAVKAARNHLTSDRFIVCNTDEIRAHFDAKRFIETSLLLVGPENGTMATAYSDNLYRHRLVKTKRNGLILKTQLKQAAYLDLPEKRGVVNTGFLLLPSAYIDALDDRYGHDWSSIIDPLVEQGRLYSVLNRSVHYFNVGTATELQESLLYLQSVKQPPERIKLKAAR